MKFKIALVLFLLNLTLSLRANQETLSLHAETLSAKAVKNSSIYGKLESFDPGQHKTIIRISHLPNAESYILRWERPLLIQKEHFQKYSREMLLRNGDFLGENGAIIAISSRGFLPGEKVNLSLETEDGKMLSQKIDLFPHPLVLEIRGGQSKFKGELTCMNPTRYEILLEGIQTYEKLKIISDSSGEHLENDLYYTQGSCIALMPGVIGKEGGFCDLSITRQKGDKFELKLPWGKELLKYLEGEKEPMVLDFSSVAIEKRDLK